MVFQDISSRISPGVWVLGVGRDGEGEGEGGGGWRPPCKMTGMRGSDFEPFFPGKAVSI